MNDDLYTTPPESRPVLFVDVDGVLSLFGLDRAGGAEEVGPLHWVDGIAHCVPAAAGPRLVRLAERFELVWATGWEEKANEYLPLILDLPFGRLPCLTFGGRAVFGSSDWKLDALAAFAADRPAAWIDDNLGERCRRWAEERSAPTLLVETRCNVGMTDEHVELLLGWAEQVAPTLPSSQAAADPPGAGAIPARLGRIAVSSRYA